MRPQIEILPLANAAEVYQRTQSSDAKFRMVPMMVVLSADPLAPQILTLDACPKADACRAPTWNAPRLVPEEMPEAESS